MLEQGMMQFALLGAGWVLWLLVALSVGCLAIAIERAIFLIRDASNLDALRDSVNAFLNDGQAEPFLGRLKSQGGLESRVLLAGLEIHGLGPASVEQAMRGTATAEKMKMDRGIFFLATVGSNAPFLGLFGTVLGIIRAFHDMAQNTADGSSAVMAGISEALVATAVGLLVAIPAVVLYNLFSRWIKSRLMRTDSLADLVVARLRGER